jgi:hypothetical protein
MEMRRAKLELETDCEATTILGSVGSMVQAVRSVCCNQHMMPLSYWILCTLLKRMATQELANVPEDHKKWLKSR